jgi:hypothetical protein
MKLGIIAIAALFLPACANPAADASSFATTFASIANAVDQGLSTFEDIAQATGAAVTVVETVVGDLAKSSPPSDSGAASSSPSISLRAKAAQVHHKS